MKGSEDFIWESKEGVMVEGRGPTEFKSSFESIKSYEYMHIFS